MILIKEKLSKINGLRYRPTCLIMGRIGDGKTTVKNMLCGTNHEAGVAENSMTRKLFINTVSCGDDAFDIIDTPGTESNKDRLGHAYVLWNGLIARPLNTIFILMKYESRYDLLVRKYEDSIKPIDNYEQKVVILISHLDLAENPNEEFTKICKSFEDQQISANIIFYSKESDKNELSNLIYSCLSNMPQNQLVITEIDFFEKFDLAHIPELRDMRKKYQKCKTEINKKSQSFNQALSSIDSIPVEEKDEWLHCSIVSHSNHLRSLLEDYENEFKNQMIDLDFYLFQIEMNRMIIEMEDHYVDRVKPLMSFDLFDKKDPRNLVKKCPNCGEVWFKVEGCDGETNCGNVSETGEIIFGLIKRLKYLFYFNPINPTKVEWNKDQKFDTIDIVKQYESNIKLYRIGRRYNALMSLISRINSNIQLFNIYQLEVLKCLNDDFCQTNNIELNNTPRELTSFNLALSGLKSNLHLNTDNELINQVMNQLKLIYDFLKKYQKSKQTDKVKPVGCGSSFIWKDQPPVSPDLIREFYKVNSNGKVINIFETSRRTFDDYTQNFDTKLYQD